MRRTSDSYVPLICFYHRFPSGGYQEAETWCRWVNATQILKVAGVPKSARTKILEKEILSGVHEKVQGGCESFGRSVLRFANNESDGKYQGTW